MCSALIAVDPAADTARLRAGRGCRRRHVFRKLGLDALRHLRRGFRIVGLAHQLLKIRSERGAELVFRDSGDLGFFDGDGSLAEGGHGGSQH